MSSFADLLAPDPGLEPGAIQTRAQQFLPDVVRHSPLSWLEPGVTPNGTGRKLLIGVAAWSRYDLTLLDRVRDALSDGVATGTTVIVFDLDALGAAAVERLIPGISPVLQTPAVGFWENGLLRESASGLFGRQLVAKALGLGETTVHPAAPATAS